MEYQITDEMLEHARIIIREIAREYGVPEAEVRADMQEAMQAGMNSPEPEVRKRWKEMTWREDEPTVEEFIAWMTLTVERRMSETEEIN